MINMKISSSAFGNNSTIPKKYTCEGQDINPPLQFDEIPPETKSLALIMDDPDAPMGTWVHWVVWNISPNTLKIAENDVPQAAVLGINDSRKLEYGGPCPPPGKPHRYFFKLYALDIVISLKQGSFKKDLEEIMEKHILAKAELVGLYQR